MPTTRTITGPISQADGSAYAGTLEIAWAAGVSPDGATIVAGRVRGRLPVDLVPYTYSVRYESGVVKAWVVPVGAGSLTVAQVES